jgi:hypothetical protein
VLNTAAVSCSYGKFCSQLLVVLLVPGESSVRLRVMFRHPVISKLRTEFSVLPGTAWGLILAWGRRLYSADTENVEDQTRSAVLLEKLLVKKFPVLYGTQRFMIVFTRPRQWSLSWARWIQSTPTHPVYLKSILILPFHIAWVLSSCLNPSDSPTNILHAFLGYVMRATFPAHPSWFPHPNDIWLKVNCDRCVSRIGVLVFMLLSHVDNLNN